MHFQFDYLCSVATHKSCRVSIRKDLEANQITHVGMKMVYVLHASFHPGSFFRGAKPIVLQISVVMLSFRPNWGGESLREEENFRLRPPHPPWMKAGMDSTLVREYPLPSR